MKKQWQSWHLHHLARRAKVFGIEKTLINALEKSGWYLTKGKNIPPSLSPILEDSLKRLASIKDFDKTCDNEECPICKKLKENYSAEAIQSTPFKLSVELYRWQKEAKKAWWENNGKGIVKVVTGAGKTVFALSLISVLYNSTAYKEGGLKTIIIVPTSALLDQWLISLMDKLNIPREKIGVFYGHEKESFDGRVLLLYVVNSAREYISEHFKNYFSEDDTFLIADECHRYGSK